jgi:hypothetical protein
MLTNRHRELTRIDAAGRRAFLTALGRKRGARICHYTAEPCAATPAEFARLIADSAESGHQFRSTVNT